MISGRTRYDYNCAMATENFFADLPVLEDFSSITDLAGFQSLPEDWWVIVADIRNSTGAIQSGQYKAVNIIGVAVITAIMNSARPLVIPYIFGGDGATLCIPSGLVVQAREDLVNTMQMAHSVYGLSLRAGLVPIARIRQSGADVLVARHRVSRYYVQAAFAGGGVELAERLIKDELAGAQFRLQETGTAPVADYSGLECRWDNVPSQHGEIISLIVKAVAATLDGETQLYKEVLAMVRQIYGADDDCRPVRTEGLHLTFANAKLRHEARIRTYGRGVPAYMSYWFKLRIQNILGWLFMRLGITTAGTPWGDYKQDLVLNSDFKKFDGVLRAVLSGTTAQRRQLTAYLESRYLLGECVYGVHASDSALITCLISKRAGDHYHFIDGADGGYAMAAAAMKQRLQALTSA